MAVLTMLRKSAENGQRVSVTMYDTPQRVMMTYAGSSACWLVLLVLDALMIAAASGMWHDGGFGATTPFFSIVLVFNIIMFAAQTVDAMLFDHTFWPLQAIKWTTAIFSIASLAAVLGAAFGVHDGHRDARIGATAVLLFLQTVFVASSLSLTLEYLYRASRRTVS